MKIKLYVHEIKNIRRDFDTIQTYYSVSQINYCTEKYKFKNNATKIL